MRKASHLCKGDQAETLACSHLQQTGLQLVEKNYRCKGGEIDLIMRDGESLVFVEVRFRKSSSFGSAAESVTASKQRKLITAASHYLQRQRNSWPCRFDVVGITGEHDPVIQWIKDAFQSA